MNRLHERATRRSTRFTMVAMLAVAMIVAGCGSGSGSPHPASLGGGLSSTAPPATSTVAPTTSVGASSTFQSAPAGSGQTAVASATATSQGTAAATAGPSGACDPPDEAVPAAAVPGDQPPSITLKPVADGLDTPIGIVAPPDTSGRLFIVEQGGKIRILRDGSLAAEPFLDISSSITSGGERGLLGLAFHPEYACNGRFFVNYTDEQGDTVVAEYRVSPDNPDLADPTATAMLLHIDQPFPNHNGGDVVFGPDGMLYIGMGDGGSGGDPMGNGQRVDTLLGKLLRIDVDKPADGKAYSTPPANCSGCPSDALPEIFAIGLRNPWRFTFDRATSDLWIGDVGQGRYEEVDHLPLAGSNGANFGWNIMEGRHCFPSGTSCDRAGLTLPVAEYDHSAGDCSITGGYVYRGAAFPSLAGWFLFSDYCTGTVRAVAADGPAAGADPAVLLESHRSIASFGEDRAGELYVADMGSGTILQVVPGS